jgi:hypothetical protein
LVAFSLPLAKYGREVSRGNTRRSNFHLLWS